MMNKKAKYRVTSVNKGHLMVRAQEYKSERGYTGGVVVFFDNVLCGWVDEVRNPEQWQPGCFAIDDEGLLYETRGGDGDKGAREWVLSQGVKRFDCRGGVCA